MITQQLADALRSAGAPEELLIALNRGKRATTVALARYVAAHLEDYVPRRAPRRPVTLPAEAQIQGILRKGGDRRTPAERAAIDLFVKWREAVERIELSNTGRLQQLRDAVMALEDHGARQTECASVRAHLRKHFACCNGMPEWRDYKTLPKSMRL